MNREGKIGAQIEMVEQRPRDQMANGHTRDPSQAGEDQALYDHLPNEPCRAGAERRAYGELALTRRGAHEKQVGNVEAGDEQDQTSDHERERSHQRNGLGYGFQGQRAGVAAQARRARQSLRRCP